MLQKIRSSYIMEIPFSLLSWQKALNLVKYNNSLKSRMNININNYMEYSGKYIIYETKGKGKEFDKYSDKLIYEGEYLNGERNGKGKEYFCCVDIGCDGESLNEERIIKKSEKDFDGRIKFEGEYLKGKKWNGKGFNENGHIIYILNDGKGLYKEFYENTKLKLECEYLNGQLNGKGYEYYYEGKLKFEGEYLNGKKWNGKEYHVDNDKLICELKEGKGFIYEYYNNDELKYEGEYLNGERNGKGKEYYIDGVIKFEGKFLNGKRNGYGKKYNNLGDLIFEGEFLYNNKKRGKEYVNERLEYEGEFLFDKKWNGKGYDENGNIIYIY